MKRRVFTILSALSLLLCVAGVAVLTSNQWLEGSFGKIGSNYSAYVLAASGTITVYFQRTDTGEAPRWFGGVWKAPTGPTPGRFRWDRLGFGYAVGGTRGGNSIYAWTIPDWFLIVAFASWPASRWIRQRRFASRPLGECRCCGYDLRATPDRCPECGAAPAKAGR